MDIVSKWVDEGCIMLSTNLAGCAQNTITKN